MVASSPVRASQVGSGSGQVGASRGVWLCYGQASVVVKEVPRWVRSYNDGPIKKGLAEVLWSQWSYSGALFGSLP